MTLLTCSILFLLGAIIASFIGVVVVRLHTGQSILRGRSRCDACTTALSPLSLVPILSYMVYRGKASCCGAVISRLSPLTEMLLGGLFVASYVRLGLSLALLFFCVALALMLMLVLYDLAHQILPPIPLTLFVGVSACAGYLAAPHEAVSNLSIALLLAAGIAMIHIVSRGRAMGFADAPFVFGLSLLAGTAAFPGLVFSFWIGAVVGIAILARRPRGSRMGVEVPFAPFLAAGFLLAYFTQWNPYLFIAAIH